MLDSKTNVGMDFLFISCSMSAYDNVGVGMFKDSLWMVTFTLPPSLNSSKSTPICMISSSYIESQGSSSTSSSVLSKVLAFQ